MKEQVLQLANQAGIAVDVLPETIIDNGALYAIPSYCTAEAYKKVVMIVDQNTNQAAGEDLFEQLVEEEDLLVTRIEVKPNKHHQVIADEQALVQVLLETPQDADLLLAVGSGTIHDIVRFVGYKMDIPFVSVPTAASVDGFASKGAPLILRGFKQTIQTASPIAIFADVDIIKQAPKEMTAAGFGDILGKYTSLVDWKISALIGNEPYNQLAAEITKQSLDNIVEYAGQIASNDNHIHILMESLIDSGLVMLILNHSRPASGAEHHLSHYWEMELLEKDKPQLLHGAKVGVATTIIASLYKHILAGVDVNAISDENNLKQDLPANWNEIKSLIEELPSAEVLQKLLQQVGGPTTPAELGIDDQLVEKSLNEAYTLRERCTGLFILNKIKEDNIKLPL